jgi:hypothetical protein
LLLFDLKAWGEISGKGEVLLADRVIAKVIVEIEIKELPETSSWEAKPSINRGLASVSCGREVGGATVRITIGRCSR